jgi:hypothetical protein
VDEPERWQDAHIDGVNIINQIIPASYATSFRAAAGTATAGPGNECLPQAPTSGYERYRRAGQEDPLSRRR